MTEAAADASRRQTHNVPAAGGDAHVEDDDNSPAGSGDKNQNGSAADDVAQEMCVDMEDDRLVDAEDDSGQVGLTLV